MIAPQVSASTADALMGCLALGEVALDDAAWESLARTHAREGAWGRVASLYDARQNAPAVFDDVLRGSE